MKELRKRNEELAKNYTYDTSMGENNIPVTDSTVGRTVELPDFNVTPKYSARSAMRGKLPKHMTMSGPAQKKKSNLVTNNPFVPKKKYKKR